jgi:prolipoprotein diacylglyceryltransferase
MALELLALGMWSWIVYIVAIIAAVWVIVDVWKKKKGMKKEEKWIWTIAALIFSIVTAIVYYFLKKK